ncbi:small GTP-binding protein domain-containing protein [Candidatus Omnitrophus magneticus]|uniref:Small GTP-binding protein domain-containing protein n=1 Tax=Candidatus Omnitrophus magneticus TaxID=1609969 RepID=A0A0F0CTH7_9BACT|nr:small GTP-binding protein domain-containing protein [Candidatus Omnitrophus magneticus]
MYSTPKSNRLHIGIFGRRNSGKSSIINAITGQSLAIVSDIPGTTTDPVYKSMEILPIGPCVLIDTAGIDDDSILGNERIKKTMKVFRKTDVAILVVDVHIGMGKFEEELIIRFKSAKIPFVIIVNKCDLKRSSELISKLSEKGYTYLEVSTHTGQGIEDLKKNIIKIAPDDWASIPLVGDIVNPNDLIVMVCPIDSAMPRGRLILPQVQVLRDILDSDASAVVVKDTELTDVLSKLASPPDLVITDSQVFETVKEILPSEIPLTSFSTIYARHKGDLNVFLEGVKVLNELNDGDEILIAEACTHHVQAEDIGRSKIPTWLLNMTGKNLEFDITAGGDFPEDVSKYQMIITCGGCMINRREMMFRIETAVKSGVAITNYGILIAYINGILERVVEPFSQNK